MPMNFLLKTTLVLWLSLMPVTVVPFLSSGRSAEAQPLKEVRIASSTTVSFTNLSTFYARDKGFFEKEGLDTKIIVVQTNAALAALVSGNVDYTTLSTSAIEAALRGMPVRLVAVTSQQPVWGLVVRKGITKVADLKGRKIAVSSYGGASYAAVVYVLKQHGINPKEVTILATGETLARIAALRNEAVDAAIIAAPGDMKALTLGDFRLLLDVGSMYKLPMGGISTSQAKIRENPSEIRRLVRAVVGATRFIVDARNKSEVLNYIAAGFKLDRHSSEELYKRVVPSLSTTGMVEGDKIKLVIDSAVERGLTDKAVEPDAVVDFSFVKELGR
ncbi:MAG: ABC transporter substrate-binding protein [Deltaproteobacteria bacterium]|nr:ABC transporter substrate-binding protein [Deltaproteobacteria bacterium]